MSKWTIEGYNASVWTEYPLSDVNITMTLNGINTANCSVAKLTSTNYLTIGQLIRILYNGTEMFNGYIDTVTQQNTAQFNIVASEYANKLQNFYVQDGVDDYTVGVDNSAETKKISEYVSTILNLGNAYTTGYTDNSRAGIKDATTIPDGDAPKSVLFKFATCYDGLTSFLTDMCNLKMRFDYNTSTHAKSIRYGTVTTYDDTQRLSDKTTYITITNDVLNVRSEDDNFDYAIDKIVVVNSADSSYYGSATVVTPANTPPKTLVFQYENIQSDDEANQIAAALLNQRSATNSRKTLTLPVGYINSTLGEAIREGDFVYLGEMMPDGTTPIVYSVQDITYNTASTEIGLNGYFDNAWTTFSNKKRVSSTGVFEGVEAVWDGGKRNMYASETTTYHFNCQDTDKLGDSFNLTLEFDKWDNNISVNQYSGSPSSNEESPTGSSYKTGGYASATQEQNIYSLGWDSPTAPPKIRTILNSGTNFYTLSEATFYDLFSGNTSWQALTFDTGTDIGADFGFIEGNVTVIPKFYYTNSYFTIRIDLFKNGTTPSDSIRHWLYDLVPTTTVTSAKILTEMPFNLSFSYTLDGFSTQTQSYYIGIKISNTSDTESMDVKVASSYVAIRHYGRHDHNYGIIEDEWELPVNTVEHDHSTDISHLHTATSSVYGSGVVSPTLTIINGTTSNSFDISSTSGVASVTKNIISALHNGDNEIRITSTADCSVVARATYTSY